MLSVCNGDHANIIILWKSVWTELLHATAKAHRHVNYNLPRNKVWEAMDPVERGTLDRCLIIYQGGSSAGIARVVVPIRWEDVDTQRIFWARDVSTNVTKQYYVELCTVCIHHS